MNPVYPNPFLGPFPPFMPITKFVSQILRSLYRPICRGTAPDADKVEHLISRIITPEELLATPPVDAAERAHRRELTQYAIVPVLGIVY